MFKLRVVLVDGTNVESIAETVQIENELVELDQQVGTDINTRLNEGEEFKDGDPWEKVILEMNANSFTSKAVEETLMEEGEEIPAAPLNKTKLCEHTETIRL